MSKGKNKSSRRTGTFLILLGLMLICAAAGLTVYNLRDNERAGEEAAEVEVKLEEQIVEKIEEKEKAKETEPEEAEIETASPEITYREMAQEMIDGFSYIGILEFPALKLTLPVMYDWDMDRLKKSPCRFSGSYYTDDLVICGHNYRKHFSPVRSLPSGSDVYLHTVDGQKLHYIISNVETIKPKQVEEMVSNSNNSDSENDWDMTLFTCTVGGRARWTIRCERAD